MGSIAWSAGVVLTLATVSGNQNPADAATRPPGRPFADWSAEEVGNFLLQKHFDQALVARLREAVNRRGLEGAVAAGLDHVQLEALGWTSKLARTRLLLEIEAAVASTQSSTSDARSGVEVQVDSSDTNPNDKPPTNGNDPTPDVQLGKSTNREKTRGGDCDSSVAAVRRETEPRGADAARPDGACSSSPAPTAAREPTLTQMSKTRLCHLAIISAPQNGEQRNAVRATWGVDARSRDDMSYTFYVAASGDDDAIARENATHHDIVLLADIVDSYANLSLKVPAAIRHATRSHAFRFVAKIDDDTFVNVAGLSKLLKPARRKRLYLGTKWSGNRPQRSTSSKHHVPESAWPLSVLPPYCEGGAYVLSRDLAEYLVVGEPWLRPIRGLEDVSMALWMLGLQVHPMHSSRFISHNVITQGRNDVVPAARKKACGPDLVTMPDVPPALLRKMHGQRNSNNGVCSALN